MYKWNEDKNSILKLQRSFSFDDVVLHIKENGIIDNYKHPNKEKYTNEELELLDSIENESVERIDFDNDALKIMAEKTLDYLNEKSKSASI